jgi:hypothetical protein
VERFLLLWDELDEVMGYGRHLAVGLSAAVTHQGRQLRSGLWALSGREPAGTATIGKMRLPTP